MCLTLGIVMPRMAAAETIETALAKAYQNNPQLNAQRAIVRQADEGVPQALSGYRPTISANASIGPAPASTAANAAVRSAQIVSPYDAFSTFAPAKIRPPAHTAAPT